MDRNDSANFTPSGASPASDAAASEPSRSGARDTARDTTNGTTNGTTNDTINAEDASDGRARQGHGFAGMSKERQRALAALGGRAAHARGVGNQWTSESARAAGKRGGRAVAKDREHMSRIGKLGGAARKAKLDAARAAKAQKAQKAKQERATPLGDAHRTLRTERRELRFEPGFVDVPPAHDRHDGRFDRDA